MGSLPVFKTPAPACSARKEPSITHPGSIRRRPEQAASPAGASKGGRASAQAPHPSSCRKRQGSVAALRLLLPRQTLRWFASERPLRGRFSFASDFQQCRGDSKGGEPLCVVAEEGVTGEKPHRKGFSSRACFWLLFARAKSNSGHGAESPEIPGVRGRSPRKASDRNMFLSHPPGGYANQPCIGQMRLPSAIWRERRDAVSANR